VISNTDQSTQSPTPSSNLPDVIDADTGNTEFQFITFSIGSEDYGVDILAVREIIAWSSVTHLPNTKDYVRGVINLRGSILPVFDLRCRFGMGLTEATGTHVIIIVTVKGRLIGILADSVSQILMINESEISGVPESGLLVDQEYLGGFATSDTRMVALLDVECLFDPNILIESIEEARSAEMKVEESENSETEAPR